MQRFSFAILKIDKALCASRVSRLASTRDFSSPMTAGYVAFFAAISLPALLPSFGGLRYVENVVDDLESQTEPLSEPCHRGEFSASAFALMAPSRTEVLKIAAVLFSWMN